MSQGLLPLHARDVGMGSLCLGFALTLLLSHGAEGHQPAQAPSVAGGEPTPTLLRGMGSHHHPASPLSPHPQKFFDQRLTPLYPLNHPETLPPPPPPAPPD